jgi:simple sugar transport system ATP-binding protein
VSFDVRAREIVGIAAVAGNGQAELAEVITGLRPCTGTIAINGETVSNRSTGHAIRHGISHVPEDRTGVGSSPNLSLTDNLMMKRFRDPPISHGWLIDDTRARAVATDL